MYRIFFKKVLDFFLSSIGLLVFSPIIIVLIILLFYVNKGFPFFQQRRPGKHGEIFKIIKFKTMTDEVDKNGDLLPDIQRITKIGNFVREFSLDEIPQLFSVVKGDMSIIGPRPLLEEYLPLYSKEQSKRHDVRPGITGWAQVNGRNSIDWSDKFKLDVYYVENLSFLLDLKILFMTVIKVFKSEGVNSDDNTTMITFTGNDN